MYVAATLKSYLLLAVNLEILAVYFFFGEYSVLALLGFHDFSCLQK